MRTERWPREVNVGIIVCNLEGTILELNETAIKTYKKSGGKNLVGRNIYDCHPEEAKLKLKEIMENKRTNCYTIEKGGSKKLIYQMPWFDRGQYAGIVEFSMPIPRDIPHFVRKDG